MLTGIELFLAILPLVIAAAEHQKDIRRAGRTILSRRSKDEQQLDFYYELCDELSLLASTLESLFAGLPSRSVPDNPLQLNHEEQQALEELLGSRAEAFQSILERLLKHLENIVSDKSVDISETDISILTSATFFSKLERFKTVMGEGRTVTSLAERFRFTRNEKSRQVAMLRIKENNIKLERLLLVSDVGNSIGSRTYRPAVRKAHAARLRRFSEPLFRKIAAKWHSPCDCENDHEARLCLWNCCSHHRHSRPEDSVDMMISVSDFKTDGAPWQESLILIPPEYKPESSESGVRFAPEPTSTPSSLPSKDVDKESLCKLVTSAYGQQTTLQIVFKGGKLWQTRARRKSLGIERQRDVSLKELLTLHDGERHISLREQWVLAVVLAHAALHCSDGPWLSEHWSKEHITFFRIGPTARPDLRHPFLKLQFESHDVDGCSSNLFSIHPSPRLLSLGILLLEIYLKDTVESRWAPADLGEDGKPNENTNLTAALRLLEASEGEVYEGYRAAIRACLEFNPSGLDAEDDRQRIYQEIVLPLEEELERGFHIKPEDLHLV